MAKCACISNLIEILNIYLSFNSHLIDLKSDGIIKYCMSEDLTADLV